ncbi:MAG: hypothetical protein KatS3mg061_2367 [Dehalococcoidia bacterium]|nr:MAG: hypothetical protein KatS3mg061_2367 [Dehalococcoidia bacterium]
MTPWPATRRAQDAAGVLTGLYRDGASLATLADVIP